MSRHSTRTFCEHQPVVVVAGYDRPLRELFLHVIREAVVGEGPDEVFFYDSLDEPQRDWKDINTVLDTLERLHIVVPENMVTQIYLDQCLNVGNRIVDHGSTV